MVPFHRSVSLGLRMVVNPTSRKLEMVGGRGEGYVDLVVFGIAIADYWSCCVAHCVGR